MKAIVHDAYGPTDVSVQAGDGRVVFAKLLR